MPIQQQALDALGTEHLHADLRGRSVRGGVVTLGAQVAKFLLQTISTIVLARLLTPADFGMVAMVTAVTGIGNMFADVGLSEATIQREKVSHNHVSTLFWINVGVGLLLMLVTAALAPVLAWFYAEPRVTSVTFLMAGTFLISGLRVQHDALLKRQMRYTSLAIRDVASYVLGVSVAVVMARLEAGYWAIVALPMTVNLTQMVLSWFMVSWRPALPRRDLEVRSMLSYGGNLAASNLTSYLTRNAANVLIGWFWGASPLGLYSRAHSLLMLPLRQLNAPIRAVALPAFSRIQDDPERYARYYLRTTNLIMWLSAPLIGFLFVAAEPVIVVTLGDQWRDAAAVFQILAISALFQPLFDTTEWLFASRGRTDRLLRLGLTISPIIIASSAIGLPFGIRGVALSYSVVLLAILPWVFQYTFRGTHLTLRRFGRTLLYPLSLCLGAVVVSVLAVRLLAPAGNVLRLLVIALAFGIVYSLSALIPSARQEVLSFRNLIPDLRP